MADLVPKAVEVMTQGPLFCSAVRKTTRDGKDFVAVCRKPPGHDEHDGDHWHRDAFEGHENVVYRYWWNLVLRQAYTETDVQSYRD